jgi:hypothetical protein
LKKYVNASSETKINLVLGSYQLRVPEPAHLSMEGALI